jgi:uncharacterized protein YciI
MSAMYFALFYETIENFVERRQPFRDEHLAAARRAHAEGQLVMAGALKPADGALLIFRGDTSAVAENFARADPYVTGGLVKSWRVREWTVVIGGESA